MKKNLLVLIVLLIGLLILPVLGGQSATPPDVIHSYTVSIEPQKDGSLLINYEFDYEAVTDFPRGKAYLQVGVPNRNFEIVSYEPKELISDTKAITSSTSQVQLNFINLPLKGDRFRFNFSILQKRMIYKTDEGYGFKFVPGWFDFAQIEKLWVRVNPGEIVLIKVEPELEQKTPGQLIFLTENLKENQKAKAITITMGGDYFSIDDEEMLQKEEKSLADILIIIIVAIMIISILFLLVIMLIYNFSGGGGSGGGSSGGGGYGGGRFIGGSSGGSLKSGGGSGSFSGRGSSCVSSCACACACAGGGRAGCSEKGYRIVKLVAKPNEGSVKKNE